MDGFIIVDKPAGMTSHDVVNRIRRITGQKKAGHTGTLDPFATGVLPVALGEATKAIQFLDESVKEYQAAIRFGRTTDTQDCTGTTISEGDWRELVPERVVEIVNSFVGQQDQLPPMFSALKHKGTPLYKLARSGTTVDRALRSITVYSIGINSIDLPHLEVTVSCSPGTYIRTIAHDMGEMATCGACLDRLRRTRTGPFLIDEARSLQEIERACSEGALNRFLMDPLVALAPLDELRLTETGAVSVRNGAVPKLDEIVGISANGLVPGERVKLSFGGRLAAVAEIIADDMSNPPNSMRFLRVFN